MGDPRDAARRYIVERLATAYDACAHDRGGYSPCDTCRADAILNAPGLKVVTLASPHSDTTRTAILLPTRQPLKDGRDG